MTENPVIVRAVENLSMNGAKAVEILLMKFFSAPLIAGDRADRPCGRGLRDPLRLICATGCIRSTALVNFSRTLKHVNVHRFEETIGGRAYQIEVTAVGTRWRAQLRRIPGMPTAMMPFYGSTPVEAAQQLAQWLAIAHRRAQQATSGPAVSSL
jgi:hypothetical protein